jgi:uncharacterized protein (DUF58 family)
MKFRPSALAYGLVVVTGWIFFLAIALWRVELFLSAIPLLVALFRHGQPAEAEVAELHAMADSDQVVEGDEVQLTMQGGLRPVPGPVELLPVLPPLLVPATSVGTVIPHGSEIHWATKLRCSASGTMNVSRIVIRCWDELGLWESEAVQEQQVNVLVLPRATPVRLLPEPRRTSVPFGIHPSRVAGDGTDFAGIRPFVTGDHVKRLNWMATLRTSRLQVNEFHPERSANVIILIDTFANVGRRPDSSLDHCLRAAAGVAWRYLRQQDRVGLMEFGGWVRWHRSAAGPGQYVKLLRALAQVSVHRAEFIQDLTALPEAILPYTSLILALTPLADVRFEQMLGRLGEQGRDIVLLALRTDEVSRVRARRETILRRIWLLDREDRLQQLRGKGIRAVNWQPSLPLEAALNLARRLPATRVWP